MLVVRYVATLEDTKRMKINEIQFSLSRTIQVEPFSPLNIHYSCKAEVDISEDNRGVLQGKVEEEYKKLEMIVTSALMKKVKQFEKVYEK